VADCNLDIDKEYMMIVDPDSLQFQMKELGSPTKDMQIKSDRVFPATSMQDSQYQSKELNVHIDKNNNTASGWLHRSPTELEAERRAQSPLKMSLLGQDFMYDLYPIPEMSKVADEKNKYKRTKKKYRRTVKFLQSGHTVYGMHDFSDDEDQVQENVDQEIWEILSNYKDGGEEDLSNIEWLNLALVEFDENNLAYLTGNNDAQVRLNVVKFALSAR